ncbi:MAG: zinc ribbon domain-containing protein [Bacteroidales bacterium]|nr:zinc ribbon domain-containing protein [Bacteroidales bacterium]
MYSLELENLIEASLADGVLDENEKIALIKRAQKEGVDLAELEIYINSILQKRIQNEKIQRNEKIAAHERERKGNVCPHCTTPIPPMTKICPNCGQVVNSNETSGDRELFELIDKISIAIVEVKSATDSESFNRAKAVSESLIKKADIFYGENKKVQMLKQDMLEELTVAQKKYRNNLIMKKCISFVVWSALVFLGVCLCFIPFIFIDYQALLGTQWRKMFE